MTNLLFGPEYRSETNNLWMHVSLSFFGFFA